MNGVWKNVCPSLVNDLKGFDSEFIDEAKHNCVRLGNYLNLDIDESDSNELLDSHDSELNSEDLMELGKQMENDENDEVVLRQFTLKNLASAFELLEKSMVLFEDQDPNVEHFAKVYRAVEDAPHPLMHFLLQHHLSNRVSVASCITYVCESGKLPLP
ncbi:hypothetical protein Pcinc_032947 [Petrolisthes cinctipes]|uniref:Uncharacterized protein n=1 Tax=Petrolisthes cinctipes TaxID=88211 RepID=A0AAE1ETL2_PETCI|nr:hypothetical protein Pcinc_032947 [Petrolisthes cinctipes]